MYIDRQGILQEVGISYVVIKESGTNDIVMCDIYSIKFVTVFGDQAAKCRAKIDNKYNHNVAYIVKATLHILLPIYIPNQIKNSSRLNI